MQILMLSVAYSEVKPQQFNIQLIIPKEAADLHQFYQM